MRERRIVTRYAERPRRTTICDRTSSVPIVLNERLIAAFAIAQRHAAMHKDRAFQASSPKNFGRSADRPFFGRDLAYSILASNVPSTKYTERSQPVTPAPAREGSRGIESHGGDSPLCCPILDVLGDADGAISRIGWHRLPVRGHSGHSSSLRLR
jgi:hypothetical protein